MSTLPFEVRRCCKVLPGFQSETLSWPQYRRVISLSVSALNTLSGVLRM
jgi:hypothetical protein